MASSRKKKLLIALILIVTLGAVVGISVTRGRTDVPVVQVEKVTRRPVLESKVTANGEVRPRNFVNMTSEVPGRVIEIYVKEGDWVKAGTPLLKIDPTQISSEAESSQANLQAARAEVQNAQVQVDAARNNVLNVQASLAAAKYELERAKADLTFAEEEFRRREQLLEQGVISRAEYDRARASYRGAQALVEAQQQRVQQLEAQLRDAQIRVRQAQAQLQSARARVAQIQANYRSALDRLAKTVQKAPIDGVIANLPVRIGQYVLASFSTTPLLTIADMSEINVEVQVDETDIARVRAGQKARIRVDALGDQELEGEVSEVGRAALVRGGQALPELTPSGQEAKDFKVVIKLINLTPDIRDRLRPGMSATATITTDMRENVIAVPAAALVERDAEEVGSQAVSADGQKKRLQGVFIVQDHRAVFRPVETGISGEMEIEIVSGLEEGMEVIVGPYRELRTLKNNAIVKKEYVQNR
ncbi:MAG: efflux RND transporter periplasmic adaptor subunit [Blastocatellia bacterium]|nr:efflux RND transporter periplasmic adaptor subunit [Blastocatellia bacterium]MCS7157403.1 efflux RND transporter periplasmic adaptor subunit [Blastocatellia bacterium]MCX7752577.1 efflux RND transporter periplasmic adaptor subunit [Blastocatellia bacterium]MDW8168308.1 efflux RND transporter periplasmic adaptor subunit [Acidobacteriota bacterium]MDW8255504.1 efflux RND transporter periplasmic adaptor subunit [Acidobacteriota bacterium]